MFKTDVFYLFNHFENKSCFSQNHILFPLLFNIYFHNLDCYIEKYIIKRYKKNLKLIKLYSKSKCKLFFINTKEKNKLRLNRFYRKKNYKININCIKNSYIYVKYIRHINNVLLGIKGSKFLAEKILKTIKFFIKSNLQLNINEEKLKLLNSFSNKIPFLNMLFYNNTKNFFLYKYQNDNINNKKRKQLRIINRIQILKHKQMKILKKKCYILLRNSYTIYQKNPLNIKKDFFSLIKNSLILKGLNKEKTDQFIYQEFLRKLQQIIKKKESNIILNFLKL
jgi:hypothetical protein